MVHDLKFRLTKASITGQTLNTSSVKLGILCEKVKILLDVGAISYKPSYGCDVSDTTGQCAERLSDYKTDIYEELTIFLPLDKEIRVIKECIKQALLKGDITFFERNLIDLHYFEGVSLNELGRLTKYSGKQIGRKIEAAIDKIF